MKWGQWEQYDIKANITEPPCKDCNFFRPMIRHRTKSADLSPQFSGVTLCWAKEMYSDFSCFKERIDTEDERQLVIKSKMKEDNHETY